VLPPKNSAFVAIGPSVIAELLLKENRQELQDLLFYHILPGVILEGDFQAGEIETLSGDGVVITEEPFRINESSILDPDILGCNGVLHVIDEVLVPFGKKK